jgi:hypothetical protein
MRDVTGTISHITHTSSPWFSLFERVAATRAFAERSPIIMQSPALVSSYSMGRLESEV